LDKEVEDEQLNEFDFVEINGMKLTDPQHAYSILWNAISGEKLTNYHAVEMLDKKFSKKATKCKPIIVLLDELDIMVTKKQTIMYNFFDWPNRPKSSLIVIAIANTMDLPEKMLTNRISSRMGMKRINFQPYSFQQLRIIVQSRLEGITSFGADAIELCARKVGSVSGDARRALDICR
jgi:Cdc6-like AAA superfamily ATPase